MLGPGPVHFSRQEGFGRQEPSFGKGPSPLRKKLPLNLCFLSFFFSFFFWLEGGLPSWQALLHTWARQQAIAVNTSGARPILVEDFSTEPAYDQLLAPRLPAGGREGTDRIPKRKPPVHESWREGHCLTESQKEVVEAGVQTRVRKSAHLWQSACSPIRMRVEALTGLASAACIPSSPVQGQNRRTPMM